MRGSISIWSCYVNRLFGRAAGRRRLKRSDFRRRDLAPACIAAEVLEERALLSATFDGALSIGNDTGTSVAFDVAADADGNSYMTGAFSGTVDFDLAGAHAGDSDILTAQGGTDIFVAKYAADNSLAWVARMGGASGDIGRKIEIGGSGDVYVAGDFGGAADFGSTILSTPGDKNGFVEKLDAGGTVLWAKSFGTSANDMGQGVGVDSSGNVYALGSRLGDAYDILKYNSSGSAVWTKSVVAHVATASADLAVSASGDVFVAGGFQGTVDFDPGAGTNNVSAGGANPTGVNGQMTAGFVLKLNTSGNFSWVSPFLGKKVGSAYGLAAAQSVTLDGSGNVVVGGYYANTVDFNPGSGTTNLPTIGGAFITKLSSSGGLTWAKALESSSPTFVYGLDTDAAGSVYATGAFNGTVDLDPGAGSHNVTTAGSMDIYIVKLTSAGAYSWSETFGSTGDDGAFGVAVDPTGAVHIAGWYQGTVDFDPNPLATYNLANPGTFKNGFRLRLRQV